MTVDLMDAWTDAMTVDSLAGYWAATSAARKVVSMAAYLGDQSVGMLAD